MKYYVADESLGGVEREYNAVERNAKIGELVVLTEFRESKYAKVGDILTCTAAFWRDGSIDARKTTDDVGYAFIDKDYESYSVLEPTGRVHINGIIYRLVKRKAFLGDLVLVTDGLSPLFYDKGDRYVICDFVEGSPRIVSKTGGTIYLNDDEYYVLEEPVTFNTTSPRDVHDVIANLTGRVAKLERKLQTIEDEKADLVQVDNKITLDFENVAKLMVEKLEEALVCGTK